MNSELGWNLLLVTAMGVIFIWATRANMPDGSVEPPSEIDDAHGAAHAADHQAGDHPPIEAPYPVEVHWHSEERDHHSQERGYWRLTAILTFLAVLGALASVYFGDMGWQEARHATKEARRATGEAERQADAAEAQIAIAKDTERRQLRAYVIVSSRDVQNFSENQHGSVQAVVENMGNTPVYNAYWLAGINVVDLVGSFSYDNCFEGVFSNSGRWFFGKISNPVKERETVFTSNEIKKVQDGYGRVTFNGRYCYKDIFSDIHHTDFCIQWTWDVANKRLKPAEYCDTGNGSD